MESEEPMSRALPLTPHTVQKSAVKNQTIKEQVHTESYHEDLEREQLEIEIFCPDYLEQMQD